MSRIAALITATAAAYAGMEVISKFILCVLPTQFGKTFVSISRITEEISRDVEEGRSIHMIFTMNTLLGNSQFANRLEDVEKTYGEGSVCVFASQYSGPYMHVKKLLELKGVCSDDETCPRVIVMCSNSSRFDDGVEFLKWVDRTRPRHIARAFSYYDELHAYINPARRAQIEEIHDLEIVRCVMAFTATPEKIWENSGFWSKIRIHYLAEFYDRNYVGCADMVFNCIDNFFPSPYARPRSPEDLDIQHLDYLRQVLTTRAEILADRTRSFVPANMRRVSHYAVRDLIFEIKPSAVVCVLNGEEKTLKYIDAAKNTKTIPLMSKSEEVCETIARIVIDHGLQERPLVITGLLCVGMGQTLTHKLLGSFTSAIFGHLDLTNDEIYQLFGRICGRMKDWGEQYVQTEVYCPTVIMHRCMVMEECARVMAQEHNGEDATHEDYIRPMVGMGEIGQAAIANIRHKKVVEEVAEDTDRAYKVFETQDAAIKFGKECLGHRFNLDADPIPLAPAELRKKLSPGENPTVEYMVGRMWGIGLKSAPGKSPARKYPTNDGKWCVYWRPSLIGM